MHFPEPPLLLGGFVLAHACWSISDEPELLVPLAIVQRGEDREVLRFEADTQEIAISNGKQLLYGMSDADAWAFAREGLAVDSGMEFDVITVEIWSRAIDERIIVMQQFVPFMLRRHFQLIGDPVISIAGSLQDSVVANPILSAVERGIASHGKAGPL